MINISLFFIFKIYHTCIIVEISNLTKYNKRYKDNE